MFDRAEDSGTPSRSPLVRKLSSASWLNDKQTTALDGLRGSTRTYRRGEQIVVPGQVMPSPRLIISGWVNRCLYLRDGYRQIIGIGLPGDFLSSRAGDRGLVFYTAVAAVPTEIMTLDSGVLQALADQEPMISHALDWATDREFLNFARNSERLGRRSARFRVAHFLLELYYRQRLIGLAGDGEMSLPMRQRDIADACGLSLVHVNRTLTAFQRAGLLEYRRDSVRFLKLETLAELTDLSFERFLDSATEDDGSDLPSTARAG